MGHLFQYTVWLEGGKSQFTRTYGRHNMIYNSFLFGVSRVF